MPTVEAMAAMALLPIRDSSFTCEDYNTHMAHPWSPSPLRRAHPGPGPHTIQPEVRAIVSTHPGVCYIKGGIFYLRLCRAIPRHTIQPEDSVEKLECALQNFMRVCRLPLAT